MKKVIIFTLLIAITGLSELPVFATNGSQLIGVGSASRSMGGTGIANPLTVDSAIHENPATLPYFHEMEIALGMSVMLGFQDATRAGSKENSKDEFTFAPATGFITPISEHLFFGFGANQVGKIETDYRNASSVDHITSRFRRWEFTPALALACADILSVGVSLPISYQIFHFDTSNYANTSGASDSLGLALRFGAAIDIQDIVRIGITYRTESLISPVHSRALVDSSGAYKDLILASPSEAGIGVSLLYIDNWIISIDGKIINWSKADGWKDFGWKSQIVVKGGVEYKMYPFLNIRVGANFSTSPYSESSGWTDAGTTTVQSATMTNRDFHALKIIGMSAATYLHFTGGIGYDISSSIQLNLGGVVTFPPTTKTETNAAGASYSSRTLINFTFDAGISILL